MATTGPVLSEETALIAAQPHLLASGGVAQYMIQRGLVDLSDATDAC